MPKSLSRRDLLKGAAAAASALAADCLPIPAMAADAAPASSVPISPAAAPPDGAILPLDCTSGVTLPPRGRSFQKFSFGFPEPSVSFNSLQLSFRIYTFENTYALDRDQMRVSAQPDGLLLDCAGFVWAGGQQKAPGRLQSRIRRNGSFTEWNVTAEMDRPIKSVSAILRGVPRGKIAAGSAQFFDPREDEILLGYPFGGGSHHLARGLDTPLAVIEAGPGVYFFLSTLLHRVRANRIYFQPGPQSYRVELTYEREGWARGNRLEGPTWRAGHATKAEDAFAPHFDHLQRAFALPDWESRPDVPAWFRQIQLALAIHGMHWTGYIFNDFAKAQRILAWVAQQIPPKNVMVFLPAWNGRYYWDYPAYQADPRLGGEAGFRQLIHDGQRLGFRFLPMFGMNAANVDLPDYSHFADAATAQIDGNDFGLDWVDWDNDRHSEGWGKYMNLGVDSWREWMRQSIADAIDRYKIDGYFLDISGGWENNTKADMHEGTRRLVADLRAKYPDVLAVGEFSYDALLSILPVYQVFPSWGYPPAFQKFARSFQHLSHPAPGRGSSGVHESGFGDFNPKTLSLSKWEIPTITVVDDTFDRHREVMSQIIQQAKSRARLG